MYPRKDDDSGLYGYWGRDSWAIHPQFDYACSFASGYAAVRQVDGRSGLIGKDGMCLLLENICGGRTPLLADRSSPNSFYFTGFGYFDSQPLRYAVVSTDDHGRREWGLIDTSLAYRPLPDKVFSEALSVIPYGEYVVIVRASGRRHESSCGLFNLRDMRLDLPVDYSDIYPSRESIWVVSRPIGDPQETRRFAFYDVSKREFLPGRFFYALPFSCGFGSISEERDGGSYFVDEGLRPAFDAEFDDVRRFSFGLAAVYKGDDAGYIDTTGRMRLLLPYDELKPFNEFGLAIAHRDERERDIIDREGRARLAGLEVADFREGDFPYFEVTKDGEDHLFDIDLNRVF